MSRYEPDPIESSEIMELLGASFIDVDDPKRYQKLKDIMDYFKDITDSRYQILRIISKRPSFQEPQMDLLETVWIWVQLTNERIQKLKGLNKEIFTEDVVKEIESEYLTGDKIKLIKHQIDDRIKEQERIEKEKVSEKIAEVKINKKGDESTKKAMEISTLIETKKTLEEVESINNLLNQ